MVDQHCWVIYHLICWDSSCLSSHLIRFTYTSARCCLWVFNTGKSEFPFCPLLINPQSSGLHVCNMYGTQPKRQICNSMMFQFLTMLSTPYESRWAPQMFSSSHSMFFQDFSPHTSTPKAGWVLLLLSSIFYLTMVHLDRLQDPSQHSPQVHIRPYSSFTPPHLTFTPSHLPAPGMKAQKCSLLSMEASVGSPIGVGSLPGSKP